MKNLYKSPKKQEILHENLSLLKLFVKKFSYEKLFPQLNNSLKEDKEKNKNSAKPPPKKKTSELIIEKMRRYFRK